MHKEDGHPFMRGLHIYTSRDPSNWLTPGGWERRPAAARARSEAPVGSRAGRGRRGVLSGRHNSTRAASIIRDARRSTRGIEGGGRSSTRAASISRARSASGNRTRGAALPPPAPLRNPVEGKGTATARGPRGKGARHPPVAPPAVPLPDGDGTPHTRGGGDVGSIFI